MLTTSSARRVIAVAASASVLLLGLTACAPAANTVAESGGGLKTEVSPAEWRVNMDDCMLDAGFDIRVPVAADGTPSGTVDTSQFDMTEFDNAYGVCTKEVGEYPVDENIPTEEELFESQLIFATCMREAGYDYPDPVKGSGGMSQAFGPDTDTEVVDACSAEAYPQLAEQ